MFGSIILLALQAATTQQVALASAAETPSQQEAEPVAAETQTRRVCRTVLDSRTGPIAKQRKICRAVPVTDNGAN